MSYTKIKTHPTTNELEVHYNPNPTPKREDFKEFIHYQESLWTWQSKTIIVPFASDDDKLKVYGSLNPMLPEAIKRTLQQGIEVDCIEVRVDSLLLRNPPIKNYKAYFKEAVKVEEKLPEIKLGKLFLVDGKKYLITIPKTPSQGLNEHGHFVALLFDL